MLNYSSNLGVKIHGFVINDVLLYSAMYDKDQINVMKTVNLPDKYRL